MTISEQNRQVREVVDQIVARLAELDRLSEDVSPHPLGPPASEASVEALERRIGMSLPSDYKAFLLMHDGWEGFSGENALLSVAQMTSGPIQAHLADLQGTLRDLGQTRAAEGLVIEASFGTRLAYFDRATGNGEHPEVVFWDRREIKRYGSFLEYLEDYVSSLDELIAQEKENVR